MGHHHHHHHHNNNNHKSRLAQQKQVQTSNQPISPTPVSSPAGARDAVSPLSISLQSFIAHPLPFSHQPLLVVSAKAPRAHTATLPSITHSSRSSAPCHSAAEYSVSVLPFPCPASPHPPFYPSIHPVSIANYKTCEHAALTRGFLWRSASIKAKVKVAICATALFSWRLGHPELNSRRRGKGAQGRSGWRTGKKALGGCDVNSMALPGRWDIRVADDDYDDCQDYYRRRYRCTFHDLQSVG